MTTTLSTIEDLTTILTSTATHWVTATQSITQTMTAITTVVFPEPTSAYILPTLLVVIALLLASIDKGKPATEIWATTNVGHEHITLITLFPSLARHAGQKLQP